MTRQPPRPKIQVLSGTLREIAAALEGKEYFSNSSLTTAACHRRSQFERVLRIGTGRPSPSADAGTTLHSGLEFFHRERDVEAGVDALLNTWNTLFHGPGDVEAKFTREVLLDIYTSYIWEYRTRHFEPLPEHVELGIAAEFQPEDQEPFNYVCRIDLMTPSSDFENKLAVVDHKSKSRMGAELAGSFQPDNQFVGNSHMARLAYGVERVARGAIANVLYVHPHERKFQRIAMAYTPDDYLSWEQDVCGQVAALRTSAARGYWPKNTSQCGSYGACGYKRICNHNMSTSVIASYPARTHNPFGMSLDEED